MNKFERFLLNDSPAIWGQPDLDPAECFGLQPGTTIRELGAAGKNGKETSSNRIFPFDPPVIYQGLIKANIIKPGHYEKWEVYAAFEIPEKVTPKRLFAPLGRLYMLFLVMEHGYLWQEKIRLSNTMTYKAVFKTV